MIDKLINYKNKLAANKQAIPALAQAVLPQAGTAFLYLLGGCTLIALLLGVLCLPVLLFWFCWNEFAHNVLGFHYATFLEAIAGTVSLFVVVGIVYGLKESK